MRVFNWIIPSLWIIIFIIEVVGMYLGGTCSWILALVPAGFMIYNSCENAIIEDLIDSGIIQFEEEDEDEIE